MFGLQSKFKVVVAKRYSVQRSGGQQRWPERGIFQMKNDTRGKKALCIAGDSKGIMS